MSFESPVPEEILRAAESQPTIEIAETPEQAEAALESAFSRHFNPEAEVKAYRDRIQRMPPTPYRHADPNNVMAREQYREYVEEIGQPGMADQWALQAAIPKLNAVARQWQEEWERVRRPQLQGVFAATQSPGKQALLRSLIEAQGFAPQFSSEEDYSDEAAYQRSFQSLGAQPHGSAAVLAGTKVKEAIPGMIGLGLDTAVVCNDQLLHKVPSVSEARQQLLQLSGQTIFVEDGIAMKFTSYSGERFRYSENVIVEMKLGAFGEAEVDRYIEQAGDRVTSVSGAIDYSSAEGQALVDDQQPTLVYLLGPRDLVEKQGIDDVDRQKAIQLAKPALPALNHYFQGVPRQPLNSVLAGSEYVYEHL